MTKQHSAFNFLLFFLALFITRVASAQPEIIDTAQTYSDAIGTQVYNYQEDNSPLDPTESLKKFHTDQFVKSDKYVLNFGIAAKPVWIAFEVNNSADTTIKRYLTFETSWLDKIELYIVTNNQIVKQYTLGDIYPFDERPIDERFFSISHDFPAGHTTILARIETPDPLVLPIYFSSSEQHQARYLKQGYLYGLLYGALLSLLAYNFILYFSLGLRRYLFYSIHLGVFILTNMAYTGHGYQWFWPNSPLWQQWANPIFMTIFGTSGLIFATHFLNTKKLYPYIHKTVIIIFSIFLGLLILALLRQDQVLALVSAFAFISSYALILITMGVVSLYSGNKSAQFFLLATVTAGITASISAASLLDIIAFTDLRYHAAEIGMVFDAIFLALALVHLFRVAEAKKLAAENMARIDPLTSLNNRRAFYEFASVVWNGSLRKNNEVSIIMLDIDKFKVLNDTFGHTTGDDILIQISQLLKSENRAGDVLARWGGEEFIILLPDTTEQDAITIAERLRREIAALSVTFEHKNIILSASFGVASKIINNSASIDKLISSADQYLYHAKVTGRNRVCSSKDLNEQALII